MTYTWYLAKIKNGEPAILEKDKFDDLKYFSWNELLGMRNKLSANTHNLAEVYFSKQIKLS